MIVLVGQNLELHKHDQRYQDIFLRRILRLYLFLIILHDREQDQHDEEHQKSQPHHEHIIYYCSYLYLLVSELTLSERTYALYTLETYWQLPRLLLHLFPREKPEIPLLQAFIQNSYYSVLERTLTYNLQ